MSDPIFTTDSLVMLVGPSGSGKSSWAHRYFRHTQVVSSDRCRALVSDDEGNQRVHREAFAVFYTLLRQRTRLGRLTVADSTALQPFSRARMRTIAADAGRPIHAVALAAPLETLLRLDRTRRRRVPPQVLEQHAHQMLQLLESGALEEEGYASVTYLHHPDILGVRPQLIAPPDAETEKGPLQQTEAAP